MNHFFIINPASGQSDASQTLPSIIDEIFKFKNEPYEIYITKGPKDSYVKAAEKAKDLTEDTIFYACGGDGTSFDVLNGIMGKPHAFFGVIPVGSCNDFLKTFKDYNFKDFESVINGELRDIDVVSVNDLYYINELNIGFDALVNDDCNKSKIKEKSVKKAYNRAIIKNLLKFKTHHIKATFNNQEHDFKALLLVVANGKYYGSKYCCAPYASPFDGLLDFVVVDKISRLRFISMIKGYEKGEHLKNKKYQKIVHFENIESIKLTSDETMVTCLDGEIYYFKEINVKINKGALKMLFPKVKEDE